MSDNEIVFIEDTFQVGSFEIDGYQFWGVYRPDGKQMPKMFRDDGSYWNGSIEQDGPDYWAFDNWQHAASDARDLNNVVYRAICKR